MWETTVSATLDQIQPVTEQINARLAALGCPERARIKLDVAVDELLGNIIRYAYRHGTGPATVRMDVEEQPRCVVITFIDRGRPYDPLSAEFKDTTHLPAKQRPIGGLGLYMVKKTMDAFDYAYRDGQNMTTIRKRI